MFWENAIGCGSREGVAMDCSDNTTGWRKWVASNSSILWGIGLLLSAGVIALLIWEYSTVPGIAFLGSAAEFLGLAGALTITVDPFLKRKLQRDTAEDIFHHLLGFDLPIEIRESLKDFLLRNSYYRKDVDIQVNVQTLTATEAEIAIAMSAVVVCVKKMKYCQHVAYEEAENATVLEASVTSKFHPEKSYNTCPTLTENAEEPMVWGWTGDPIELKSGEQLTTFLKLRMKRPIRDFHTFVFGSSVIHPRVRLYGSEDLFVTASKADQVNGNEHIYEKVFVEGDHFQIRWKPKPSSASSKEV
jgi:hypothetical protein